MTTPTHSHKAWTDKGGHVRVMDAARLYEPPFSDLAQGPESLFSEAEVNNICHLLDLIKARATVPNAA